ncbi:hypothetical protein EG68_04853 [Paragonimus skrjabini miyazakii]|uniref:Uncharacterized protein n=1 Tax=Paragonimus skrjabini miyazakii TaxID=59628 RepID=A0A8S9Z505_9TREM|nr:hypothetical protein EG68_04853 [Paragonimus skrjabini miyazakii]
MELSMRRTQDPPLSSLPPGHPVRKLISRLRRPSQGLSTIVSGESSLDASDLESISGSTNLEQNKSRVSIANAARLALNRTSDLEFPPPALSCTSTPRLASPIHEVKQGTLQPPESGTTTPSSIQNGAQATNVPRTGLAQLNPARKWARLISKATHPKLQNLNEESFEESKRIPAENQPTVTMSTKPTLATVATSNKLDDGGVQTISVTQKGDPGCPNIYSTAFVEMETGLKLLGQTLNKTLLTMHAELREQLAEVVKRIENLELQVGQMNQSITHVSSVIPPTPTTSHYLAPPVETLEITRPRTDPFQTVRRKDC